MASGNWFRSRAAMTVKGIIVGWSALFGTSTVARAEYLTRPYSPSNDEGMFSGRVYWKGNSLTPAGITVRPPWLCRLLPSEK